VHGPSHHDRVADARLQWLDVVVRGLPAPWVARVETEVAGPDRLVAEVDERLATVARPPARSTARPAQRLLAVLVAVPTLVVAGICAGAVVGAGRWTDTATLLASLSASGVVLTLGLLLGARLVSRAVGRRRAAVVSSAVRALLADVVEEHLAAPTRYVLGAHRAVREASVRGPAPMSVGAGTELIAAGASTDRPARGASTA
jgi:hypothetical protein